MQDSPAEPSMLVNIARFVTAYYTLRPDPAVEPNAWRSVPQAIEVPRSMLPSMKRTFSRSPKPFVITESNKKLTARFPGNGHTRALRTGFCDSLEVLTANDIEVMIDRNRGYTPCPSCPMRSKLQPRSESEFGRRYRDYSVAQPAGGRRLEVQPVAWGPADTHVTAWIEEEANHLLADDLRTVERVPFERAMKASTTHRHDYVGSYTSELGTVVDMAAIRDAKLKLGVDPLGGAECITGVSLVSATGSGRRSPTTR